MQQPTNQPTNQPTSLLPLSPPPPSLAEPRKKKPTSSAENKGALLLALLPIHSPQNLFKCFVLRFYSRQLFLLLLLFHQTSFKTTKKKKGNTKRAQEQRGMPYQSERWTWKASRRLELGRRRRLLPSSSISKTHLQLSGIHTHTHTQI